jgi:hypothetical protein
MTVEISGGQVDRLMSTQLSTALKNEGVILWNRYDDNEVYRCEWRDKDEDLVYAFYHKDGPDPQRDFDKGLTTQDSRGNEIVKVHHGESVKLSPAFTEKLRQVAEYVFKDRALEIVTNNELLNVTLTVKGGALNVMVRDRYTVDFFTILDANI